MTINFRKLSSAGFTLIELMLVIAIIAAISVVGIAAYRQQLINFQVDKTALQMQQWMEGAVAYYVNCNQWPGVAGSTDPDLTPIAQLEGKNANGDQVQTCNKKQGAATGVTYVTKGSIEKDPWGGGSNKGAYVLTPPTPPNNNFQVSTDNNVPAGLENRIAAHLPNATTSTNVVTASVTAPGQGIKPTAGAVLSVRDYCLGTVPGAPPGSSNPIQIPDASKCAAGTTPTLHLALRDFMTPGGGYSTDPNNPGTPPRGVEPDVGTPTNNVWNPTLQIFTATNIQNNNYCMLAIVSCDAPPSSDSALTNKKNTTAFLF